MSTAAATGRIHKRLLDFQIEPGEGRATLWLSLYLLFGIASVIGLKAVANSLFLSRHSARDLPFLYVAVAAVMAVIIPFYLRLSARLNQNRLTVYTQAFLASNLVLFWWLLRRNFAAMEAVVYVWVEVYSVIIPTQVWTLANHIFTTRQARRLFSILGSGGILGAALGGIFGKQMTGWIGTQALLLVYVPFLATCAAIATYLWQAERPHAHSSTKSKQLPPSNLTQSMRVIWDSRYLSLMVLLVALSAMVNILVDYQFRFIVYWEVSDTDEMTGLFAAFSSYMAVFSFLMHLVLTSRIMRWFGLNFAIFVLPLSMFLGSGVLLVSATLLAGMLIKGFDGAFRHSIDRSSTELLFVPLPVGIKQQAKSFIDMVAGRWAVGLGGLLLFLLAYVLNFSVQAISWVNLALVVPWLLVAWMLRREYVATLRSSIERKDTNAEAMLMELAGSSTSEELTETLASSDERAVETGLGWLQYGQVHAAQSNLAALLTHVSPTIRRKAMAVLAARDAPDCAPQVVRFLYLDDQVESLWLALDYLERHDPEESYVSVKGILEGPHPVLRGAVAARLLNRPDSPHRARANGVFSAFVESARGPEPAYRRAAAELLGLVGTELECQAALADFLRDPDPEVARAAIVSAGRTKRRDLIPRLIELAGDRKLKTEAREALAAFGLEILPGLQQSLLDHRLPPPVRHNLPRVFSAVGGQLAADYLAGCLQQPDLLLEYQILRALSRIRLKNPETRFDSTRINSLILNELRGQYRFVSIREGVGRDGTAGVRFLGRALEERLDRRLGNIFRLIALLYPPKAILDAYYGVTSGRRDLRANAVEFLDSVLQSPLRQMLLPIIEGRSPDWVLEYARMQLGIERRSHREALRDLLLESDPWLQSCAVYAAADQGLEGLGPLLESLVNAGDALLQETALAARRRLNPSPASPPGVSWKI